METKTDILNYYEDLVNDGVCLDNWGDENIKHFAIKNELDYRKCKEVYCENKQYLIELFSNWF